MSVGPRAGWAVGREQLTLLFQGEMVRPSMYNCLTLIKAVLGGGISGGQESCLRRGPGERRRRRVGGGGGVDSSRLLGWTVLRAAL